MSNKTAVVTGGSSGIGFAIAQQLLSAGFQVHICGRNQERLTAAVRSLARFGEVKGFTLDLADRVQIGQWAMKWEQPIHVLVNNAGVCGIETLEQGQALWENIINTNLNGLYFLTGALLKFIQSGGSIINISSQLGTEGRAGFGAYCASKHAVLGLTKCWAKELGTKQITVNAICPGWVKTEMAMADVKKIAMEKGISVDQMYSDLASGLDLKRFVEPEEIGHLTAFLASEKARAITGQSYFIK